MKIHDLKPAPGSHKARKRVGRGIAGKGGKTAGRGTKGQKARGAVPTNFEGGQMPLHMRLPKRGFNKPNRAEYAVINLGTLQQAVDAGRLDPAQTIDAAALVAAGIVSHPRDGVRLLGKGELTARLTLKLAGASASARAAVEAAGGTLETDQPASVDAAGQ
jgi:large subunit ribosomal protein L15